jgi:hypothetical protein
MGHSLGMMKLPKTAFDLAMEDQVKSYKHLIDVYDVTLEDARDLLPIGVHCNLVAKYNLRTIAELVQKRKSIPGARAIPRHRCSDGSSGQGNLALVGSLLQAEERGGAPYAGDGGQGACGSWSGVQGASRTNCEGN